MSGRIRRFRRWLAYRLLPGTTEFDVAMSRQRALHELAHIARNDDSRLQRESARESYEYLRRSVPIRDEWDNADLFDPDGDSE